MEENNQLLDKKIAVVGIGGVGGYLAAMAVFLIYILVHMKTKAGQQEADGTETKEKEKNSEGQHADS